ncbi:MAG: MarC family protein [Synoicihabitans sp.]
MLISHLINLVLGTVIALLPIANPFSTAALFLSITEGDSQEKRRQQAYKACVYVFCILVSFLIAGRFIMEFFGISIPGLRIAGGLMVARIGFSMLKPHVDEMKSKEARNEAIEKDDISFTPLAMPSMSGPGAIAVTIGLATQTKGVFDFGAVIVGIFIVSLVCYIVLRASTRVVDFLGTTGMNALCKNHGISPPLRRRAVYRQWHHWHRN